jgi:ELWxxDGT repeat protein
MPPLSRITLAVLVLCALRVQAQTPYLVKDINTTYSFSQASSNPTRFVAYRDRIFFAATTREAGTELWSTDGTSAGTSMVADIFPGPESSSPIALTVMGNGVLLFAARDANHGLELWTTDGTAGGTRMLVDINPGPNPSTIGTIRPYDGKLLFSANDGTNGQELWVSDGTVAGTRMVRDLTPGSASSTFTALRVLGNAVYFLAAGGLWKTDGTDAGTVKVRVGGGRRLAVAGTQLFFEGRTSAFSDWEPWVSDGTDSGTHLVADIRPGSEGSMDMEFNVRGFMALGNGVVFPADDGTHGRELWFSDGTAAGTHLLRDFTPGPTGSWERDSPAVVAFGDRAFFGGFDPDRGDELWATDGTASGTVLFADLAPGAAGSYPEVLAVSDGKLYVSAGTQESGRLLWVTDGTTAGTLHLDHAGEFEANIAEGLGDSAWPLGGKLYFRGETKLTGVEPWVTDGTVSGTHAIANLNADGPPSSFPRELTATNELLFFYAADTKSPRGGTDGSLWRTDGTEEGTFKLREPVQDFTTLQAAGPFVFLHETGGSFITMSDGTVAGTRSADAFMRRFGASVVQEIFPFGDTLFARLKDETLWKTTAALAAPTEELGSAGAYGFVEFADRHVFYAYAPSPGFVHGNYGLWSTDGTRAGTLAIVPDLGEMSFQKPGAVVNVAGTLFFLKRLPSEETKLWKSDGTFDGTTVVKEWPPFSSAGALVAVGRRLFLFVDGRLWTSDGTAAGTKEVASSILFSYNWREHFAPAGDRVVWVRRLPDTDVYELWGSDGTADGTRRLMNLTDQVEHVLKNIDGTVYFAGTDAAHGTEVWTTDGTPEGTTLLFDLNPGPASSDPSEFTKVGGLVYLSATTQATGDELWAIPTGPVLSISDTHASEGDSATRGASFTVTLSPAAGAAVTVEYATSDGTANAGADYDAASGTLTFAPGERSKTVTVRVRGDVARESNETFFVTLRNASGARLADPEGTAVIDEDDQNVDLAVTPQFAESSRELADAALVSNHGPNAATDIVVDVVTHPVQSSQGCTKCTISQLSPGASGSVAYNASSFFGQIYKTATARARQRDLQSANDTAAWTIGADRTIAMNAVYLTPGATATIVASSDLPVPVVTSSDPSVVSAPSTFAIPAQRFGTFTITALKPGSSLLNVNGRPSPLLITVVAEGTRPRWPRGVTLSASHIGSRFDQPLTVTVDPDGRAPFTGAPPTGTVVVTSGGREFARIDVGAAKVTAPVYLPALGLFPYVLTYGGDENFLPETMTDTAVASKGLAGLVANLDSLPGPGGGYSLSVTATGSPVAAPTGKLSVMNGNVEIASLPLVAAGPGKSVAQTTLASLPPSPTLTIRYEGDAFYLAGTQQVRVVASRRRTVRR